MKNLLVDDHDYVVMTGNAILDTLSDILWQSIHMTYQNC
jgi:hypothetical protein